MENLSRGVHTGHPIEHARGNISSIAELISAGIRPERDLPPLLARPSVRSSAIGDSPKKTSIDLPGLMPGDRWRLDVLRRVVSRTESELSGQAIGPHAAADARQSAAKITETLGPNGQFPKNRQDPAMAQNLRGASQGAELLIAK